MTGEEAVKAMRARLATVSLPMLANMLAQLGGTLDEHHRMVRAVVIDVICERCPEADAAFQAWAESDSDDVRAADAAMIGAARKAARKS
jgi:hypothetical protein